MINVDGKTYHNLARKDMESFLSKTYQVHFLYPKGEGPIRKRYKVEKPFRHYGEIVENKRVERYGATKAFVLYHYYTVNPIHTGAVIKIGGKDHMIRPRAYMNYWRRCLLLDGRNAGKVVSV